MSAPAAPRAGPGVPAALREWAGPVAGGVAAVAVFAVHLWSIGPGPGPGMGADLAAAAVALDPSHPPGHALHMPLAKAASLTPAGTIGFRVRVLSAACVAAAAALVYALALALIRLSTTDAPIGGPLAAAAIAVAAGLSGPATAAARSADVYAMQALLGSVVLWAACAPGASGDVRRLVLGAFCAGLAVAGHAPTGLLLLPPLGLAAALALARRDRSGDGDGGSATATQVSWIVLALLAGLAAAAALPLRSVEPAALLRMLLGRGADGAHHAGPPASWLPEAGPVGILQDALGPIPALAALAALAAAAAYPATRMIAAALAAFLAGPALLRAGIGSDRAPEEAAGYLVVPAFCLAAALAIPAGLALRRAARQGAAGGAGLRRDPRWRRRLAWSAALVLAGVALLHAQVRERRAEASIAADRAVSLVADALAAEPPPGAVVVIEQAPTAALARYERVVSRRRPDLAVLPVPSLAEPGRAEAAVREQPVLASILGAYLAPGDGSGSGLAAAAERLASERAFLTEPGGVVAALGPRAVFPVGLLAQVLPHAAGRADIAARRRPRPGDGLAAIAGTSLGSAVAWNLARCSAIAGRAAASLPQAPAGERDARSELRAEALALAAASRLAGAPPGAIDRLEAMLLGPMDDSAAFRDALADVDGPHVGR